jgi:hypothetical protein
LVWRPGVLVVQSAGRPGSGVTIGSLASVLADVGDQRRSFG